MRTSQPYSYSVENPATHTDPSGLSPKFINCPQNIIDFVSWWCSFFNRYAWDEKIYRINECIRKTAAKRGLLCPRVTAEAVLCFRRWCNSDGTVECRRHQAGDPAGKTCFGLFGVANPDPTDPWDYIALYLDKSDHIMKGSTFLGRPGERRRMQFPAGELVFLHELAHACGVLHGSNWRGEEASVSFQCNDIWSCCIWDVVRAGGDGSYCWKSLAVFPGGFR
ncbi:MAG: hypothetical protein DYH07_13240 [Armatimonadetes bacterium ATM1]|nr:hypothetical protein [Armatimonadetes bacterium ATM1]